MKEANKKTKDDFSIAIQCRVFLPPQTSIVVGALAEKFGLHDSTIVCDACELWADKYKSVLEDDDIADTI